jgi:hypothetical protein
MVSGSKLKIDKDIYMIVDAYVKKEKGFSVGISFALCLKIKGAQPHT